MSSLLTNLRSKSDAQKNKLAIIFAGSITLVVIGLWFLLVKNKNTDVEAKSVSTSEDLKPLFMIFKGAKMDFTKTKNESKTETPAASESGTAVVE